VDTAILALRVVVSLGVVVALLWWVQRRSAKWSTRRRAGAAIEVAGRKSIGQKASVAVVDVDGIRFVLGVTEHGVQVLHTGEAPEPAPAAEPVPAEPGPATGAPDFAAELERASGRGFSLLSAETWRLAAKSLTGSTPTRSRWPR